MAKSVEMWTEPNPRPDSDLSRLRFAKAMGIMFKAKPRCPYVAEHRNMTAHVAGHLRWDGKTMTTKYVVTLFNGTGPTAVKTDQLIVDDVKSAIATAAAVLNKGVKV